VKLIARVFAETPSNREVNGEFDVEFPGGVTLTFIGGPFSVADTLPDAFKVKAATEQYGYCDISIPVADFGTPKDEDMLRAVEGAIVAAFAGKPVFAGCGAGIGRTGTFFAAVLKVLIPDVAASTGGQVDTYVGLVRQVYLGHAVETQDQVEFIGRLDVERLRKRVKWLWARALVRRAMSKIGFARG
jgi:hypothetical protein